MLLNPSPGHTNTILSLILIVASPLALLNTILFQVVSSTSIIKGNPSNTVPPNGPNATLEQAGPFFEIKVHAERTTDYITILDIP